MTEKGTFDPVVALRQEIEGVSNILVTLTAQTRQAEMRASEAAQQHDALIKLEAFTRQELGRKRTVLSQLIEAQNKS